jgi:tetratricopeptide (TPR) repeat protein
LVSGDIMTFRAYSFLRRLLPVILLCSSVVPVRAAEPHWIRINSGHFTVLTDADERKGREVIVRFEQMRAEFAQLLMRTRLNFPEPLEIIALNSDEEYAKVAPIRQGQPITDAGFFVPGEDRNYIVLNLFEAESWRAVSHPFAHFLLSYNYPPTQGWFDEGLAEYFSSIRLDDKQVHIGGDPEIPPAPRKSLVGRPIDNRNPPKSFVELLSGPAWLTIPDLFTMRHEISDFQENSRQTLFNAESWIVMHYLLNKEKLSDAGTYFDLVENQKLPVEEAIQKAYGMTPAQFEQAVKDYFHSLAPLLQAPAAGGQAAAGVHPGEVYNLPSPVVPDEIGTSTQSIDEADGQALLAEMSLRLPEHRERALQELESIASQPKTDNAIAHRALAWSHIESKEFDEAAQDLNKAMDLDPKDPWPHYYSALAKYRAARSSGQPMHGIANTLVDLRMVLDWDPEFAEAYNMMGMARVEGGGNASAMEAMRAAIRLSPRNETYQLNMAQIYIAAKQWDAAAALLERLKASQNPQIASAARARMEDLPSLKKYGLLPQREPAAQSTASGTAAATKPTEAAPSAEKQNPQPAEESEAEHPEEPPAPPQPDKRPILFLKGKLSAVDCSQAPAAVLTVTAGKKTLKLRTPDYKALSLIGADEFSCAWTNLPVAVNYKAGGQMDGDVVSVEIQ